MMYPICAGFDRTFRHRGMVELMTQILRLVCAECILHMLGPRSFVVYLLSFVLPLRLPFAVSLISKMEFNGNSKINAPNSTFNSVTTEHDYNNSKTHTVETTNNNHQVSSAGTPIIHQYQNTHFGGNQVSGGMVGGSLNSTTTAGVAARDYQVTPPQQQYPYLQSPGYAMPYGWCYPFSQGPTAGIQQYPAYPLPDFSGAREPDHSQTQGACGYLQGTTTQSSPPQAPAASEVQITQSDPSQEPAALELGEDTVNHWTPLTPPDSPMAASRAHSI
ncbi:hypothetical protein BDN72DRAFT_957671 [Pluteus cervinus]|uniref:Uncharacterized protein n=1 Tax=Pluteus cervinus TaxID=181527 RepID=A0ACD3B4Q6_9AGAR|nr:hypothetical protein BDN72DRAFT_957671 [Pluteus cervinus]